MQTRPRSGQVTYKGTASGTVTRFLDDLLGDALSVKDFGATGNGTTNDSAAIQACITAAQAANKAVHFPDGIYVISSLGTQSGRLFLKGHGNATLRGTLTYQDTFPIAADTNSPLTTTSKYFSAEGLNFQAVGTGTYGLQLFTSEQPSFLSTFSLSRCRFFGPKGLLARHMIGFELDHCEFNNTVAGARYEGCVNGLHTACRWQNQAESGVWITYAADHGVSGILDRKGGENLKFIGCEWAVCTFGLVADQHMWLVISDCLFDYCANPLFLYGSNWAKASNSYFGASNVPVTRFSAVPGYTAPVSSNIAVYGRPGGYTVGSNVVGFTAHNCEFISYDTGSIQPIVYFDGYVNGTYPMSAEEISFHGCLFYAVQSHSAPNLLEISNASVARVTNNRFRSFNLSSTMTNAYRTYNCADWINHSNSFRTCTQSGIQVTSTYERPVGAIVQSGDPGALGSGAIWVTP